MFRILAKQQLNPTVIKMVVEAPSVAAKAQPGQFIILKVDENGDQIPFTIADFDRENGTISIIFQIVGAETYLLNQKNPGEYILGFMGPLGNPFKLHGLKRVAVVGGGIGCAIAYPAVKQLHMQGAIVDAVMGFRTKELIILENEFRQMTNSLIVLTDDGSYGTPGLAADGLNNLIKTEAYDEVIAIGPIPMMHLVSQITKQYNIETTISMNLIMVDATGMCGGCQISVDGEIKYACVDGPCFDGHRVDFEALIKRNAMYRKNEQIHKCRLSDEEEAIHGRLFQI